MELALFFFTGTFIAALLFGALLAVVYYSVLALWDVFMITRSARHRAPRRRRP